MKITILRIRHEQLNGGKRLGTAACINFPATGQRFHLDIRHGLKVAIWNILAGNYHYVWSGPNDNSDKVGQAGVALAMSRNTRKALISWRPINERMLKARFEHRHGKLTIIEAYALTNLAENEKKADFYKLLGDVAGSRSPHDITLVLSDTIVQRPMPKKWCAPLPEV